MKFFVLNKEGQGIANYRRIFGPQWAASLGTSMEDLEGKSEELSEEQLIEFLEELAQKIAVTPAQFEKQLDEAGIEWGLIDGPDNEETARNVSQMPDRLKGMAIFNPFKGTESAKALDRAVEELGFKAAYASPYRWGIKANDPRFYPCYAKAVQLDIPVFIYTAMNYRTDFPMDIGRPLFLDQVAIDFPQLRIVASCGGWPWVPELIGVARRHQNVYIDTSSHRPKYLAVPGAGFEMLMQFGNTLLQDRIVFASGAGDLGLPIGQIVAEMIALPLKESVKEKWLYRNALQLFKME
ncbi:MAG: amidohydrolase [Desulfobacterales bacterium]|nr:MAG: amidohydrolase [Desulfobacterales bacterium]